MSEPRRFIAFDFGASSGRAVVGEVSTDRFTVREIHRFDNQPLGLRRHLYWNLPGLYQELLAGLRAYRRLCGPSAEGIGVDTWGCDFGQLDRNGDLLGLPRHYRDSRTAGTPQIIDREFGNRALYMRNGIQFLVFNTLNQLIAMKRSPDPTFDATGRILFMPDLFHYLLTGIPVAELTLSSISQLYDVRENAWDREVCERFGIPTSLLAPLSPPGSVLGTLLPEISEETGVSGRVILPATHDTASAAVAVPSDAGRIAFISSGTWSIVGLEIPRPVLNDESFQMNVSNSGGAYGRTLYVKIVMGLWIVQQCRESWEREGMAVTFDEIVQAASAAPASTSFIDPDATRFLAPAGMLGEVLQAYRESGGPDLPRGDVGPIARLVFESLALKYRYTLERLMKASGASVDRIYVVGGGAKNALLNQLTADFTGLPVVAGPVEATAIGNVAVQAIGAGVLGSLEEARRLIRRAFAVEQFLPRAGFHEKEQYTRFLGATGLPTV